jgi:MoaA/NifB/PqqE/SkfB family radical SAM enzyme
MSVSIPQATDADSATDPMAGLGFLWLELTNRCNLTCVHCYAESGPHPERQDTLSPGDYVRLLDEAALLGCRAVQFIGSEPTLHPALPQLIAHARRRGYAHVEVYTNAVRLPPSLLDCFRCHDVSVAVSVYADDPAIHDAVTTHPGSHRRTIANLKRLVQAGLAVRAGVVAMETNRHRIDETQAWLRTLGVTRIGIDGARGIGRGHAVAAAGGDACLQSLCGACWQGRLSVAPDGSVSPCVMAKNWIVGSATDQSLAEIVAGDALQRTRALIRAEVWAPRQDDGQEQPALCQPKPCDPDGCMPTLICPPSDPGCVPKRAWEPEGARGAQARAEGAVHPAA